MPKLNVVNEWRPSATNRSNSKLTELSANEMNTVCNLLEDGNYIVNGANIDFIVTKMVINDWPKNFKAQRQCLKYDNFCYHYAIGFCKNSGEECSKFKRDHDKKFSIEKIYNNGKCSVYNKRKAFYLCYYLSHHCGYNQSRDLNRFETVLQQDSDFKSLLIHYDAKVFPAHMEKMKVLRQKKKDKRQRRKQNKSSRMYQADSVSQGTGATNEWMSSASTEF